MPEPSTANASSLHPRIRPIAVGLVWSAGRLLVEHGFDAVKGQAFHRPPGGGIEFGERALDTVRREFLEEMNVAVTPTRLAGVIENIFEFEGRPHHEIVFLIEARFEDPHMYDRAEFEIQEADATRTIATWKSLDELAAGNAPLYPEGLLGLLTGAR